MEVLVHKVELSAAEEATVINNMATWNNSNKNSSSFTNQATGLSGMTWDQGTFTWDAAQGTWDRVNDTWTNTSKNSSTFTNATKN